MTPTNGTLDSFLVTIVLATLAIGLPVVLVLGIRFLLDRNLSIGRSKELEKLIWQLHRIASALEHQLNLSFPAVQPGTEEPRDLAYLQQPATRVAAPSSAAVPVPNQVSMQNSASQAPAVQEPAPPPARQPAPDAPRHAGVNSMFGLEP